MVDSMILGLKSSIADSWIQKPLMGREARAEAGLTQEQLAATSGLPRTQISRIETVKHIPERATLEKVADALGRSVSYSEFN